MSLAVFWCATRSGGIVREREGLTGITMQIKGPQPPDELETGCCESAH